MNPGEKLERASELEYQARVNAAYARRMEETSERTGGRLGCLNAPSTYALHLREIDRKRALAARLRAEAAEESRV